MKIENQYIIQFKGLKEGVHEFSFSIGKPFFEAFEQLVATDGNVDVKVELIKKANQLELTIDLSGDMQVQCDRCLEFFLLPVDYSGKFLVKFSETENEPDDEIIYLHPEDHKIDLSHFLYESLSLSVPLRKVHSDLPNGEPGCNKEMLKKLNEYLIKESKNI